MKNIEKLLGAAPACRLKLIERGVERRRDRRPRRTSANMFKEKPWAAPTPPKVSALWAHLVEISVGDEIHGAYALTERGDKIDKSANRFCQLIIYKRPCSILGSRGLDLVGIEGTIRPFREKIFVMLAPDRNIRMQTSLGSND
jgi:hypothetical protein